MSANLITAARNRVGISKAELARRSATSRSTLSAYEHGRVSPTLETLERVLSSTRQRLELAPTPTWSEVDIGRGRVAFVADVLWRLEARAAVSRVELPLHLAADLRPRRCGAAGGSDLGVPVGAEATGRRTRPRSGRAALGRRTCRVEPDAGGPGEGLAAGDRTGHAVALGRGVGAAGSGIRRTGGRRNQQASDDGNALRSLSAGPRISSWSTPMAKSGATSPN